MSSEMHKWAKTTLMEVCVGMRQLLRLFLLILITDIVAQRFGKKFGNIYVQPV